MRTRRPKILFISHGLRLGGVERSLVGLLHALPPDAADIDLLLLEHEGELLPQVPPHVTVLPACADYAALCGPIKRALASRHFLTGLARVAARFVLAGRRLIGLSPGFLLARSHRYAMTFLPKVPGTYDLAASFLMPHDFAVRLVDAKRRAGWIHTDYTSVETGVAVRFEAVAWAGMDKIVAVSDDVARSFAKTFPGMEGRLSVIENVLSPAWVRRRATEQAPAAVLRARETGCTTLCSVGRLTHQKGFDVAVEAARRLKDRGMKFRWFVIGSGPDGALLREKIGSQGVEDVFILLGSMENPYPAICACDIYIQPSRYEGKAVSIREAQMLGKPVLVSEFPTVSSQVEHDVDGYVVPAGVDGLVEGILRMAADATLSRRLAATASARDYGNLAEVAKILALLPHD